MKYKEGDYIYIRKHVPIITTRRDLSFGTLSDGLSLGKGIIEFVDDIEQTYQIRFEIGVAYLGEEDFIVHESVYNSKLYKALA